PSAFDQLNQDYDNLRSALEWSLQEQGNAQLGLRLAAALPNFWEARGQFAVEKGWLETLMQRASKTASQALRAKALRAAGRLAYYQSDFPAARTFFEQSIKLDQELGNHLRLADTLGRLGFLLSVQQDYEVAESFYQESLTLFQKLNDHSGVARILSELGYIAFRRGDHELASTLLEKSLALFREPDDRYLASRSRMILGHIARLEGNYTKARSLYNKALTTVKELDNTWGIFYLLEAFAHLAIAEGQIERATRLFGATEELGKSIGTVLTPAEKADHERSIANAHASLDAVAFEQALAAGRSMTVDEAISYALTVSTD
ncbi:MAG: tetratricopeptide repeat protein, partial [Anaerolineales bacterium]|nr:tetratricopeptide repeat protein [Anaerolineales bacterium]